MLLVFKEEPMAEENNTVGQGDGSREYQMNRKMGTIFMLISATGMGLVPLFSRWATRTDMFDATQGLNGPTLSAQLWRLAVWPWAWYSS